MVVSKNCFDDDVVEEDGELAALELFNPTLFDFAPCFDAIALSKPSQAFNTTNRRKLIFRDFDLTSKGTQHYLTRKKNLEKEQKHQPELT